MYVTCSRSACNNKAWRRPGRKQAMCDWCRQMTAWLAEVHGDHVPRRRKPVHLNDSENEFLRRIERLTVRVGN